MGLNSPSLEGFFIYGVITMEVEQHGIYILSDAYFQKFNAGKMMDNKRGNRPHYFAVEIDGVLWMVPLSTQVEKYRKIISEAEKNGKKCLFYHIGKFAGKECAFLVGDMIPVTKAYVSRPYTISGVPYIVKDRSLNTPLVSKAKRYLILVRQGRIKPFVDILSIEKTLIS